MPLLQRVGKDKVINHHHEVPYRVLQKQYIFGDNDNWNLIIQGDNLEGLKSLLPQYEGKIKCIYIDPPYNTGNEGRVYNDNMNHPKIKKRLWQIVGKDGEDFNRHDKWLCMMYPRLKLLHKLLKDDGVIFISIDDNEQANLKLILDEIFWGNSFIWNLILQKSINWIVNRNNLAIQHEYLLAYWKKETKLSWIKPSEKYLSKFNKEDEYGQYKIDGILMKKWADSTRESSPNLFYPLYYNPHTWKVFSEEQVWTKEIYPIKSNWTEGRWTRGKEKVRNDGHRLYASEKWTIYIKDYIESRSEIPFKSILLDVWYINNKATNEVKEIFWDKAFDTPKPLLYIQDLIKLSTNSWDIILDSFAGSWTTAHAVLNLNKEEKGDRRFILLELMDYADTITAERMKRVIKGYGEGNKFVEGTGGGFSYYTLWEKLFDEDNNLNENLELETIKEYIRYTETKQNYNSHSKPYFLWTYKSSDYFFYYESNKTTILDLDFLTLIHRKSEFTIIYADLCYLSKEFQNQHKLIFKKIPRDITRF